MQQGPFSFLKRPSTVVLIVLGFVFVSFLLFKRMGIERTGADQTSSSTDSVAGGASTTRSRFPPAPLAPRQPSPVFTSTDGAIKFSYEAERERVLDLASRLPQTKQQILEIITRPDVFKDKHRVIKPHTIDEIMQNQMGAVKVIALRSLFQKDSTSEEIRRDLVQVIQTAKDPTIVKIANAAKDSLDKGRSFFDDFLQGIDNLPLN